MQNTLSHILSDNLDKGYYQFFWLHEGKAVIGDELFSSLKDVTALDDFGDYEFQVLHISNAGVKNVTQEAVDVWLDVNGANDDDDGYIDVPQYCARGLYSLQVA